MKEEALISIVLAVYNPNIEWLIGLLKSLNQQTYPNLEFIVCDDASTQVSWIEIEKIIQTYILKFPFYMIRNKKNIGSNQTFSYLVTKAKGEYIAFCDQDDIWKTNKIEKLYQSIREEESILSYSDVEVIDTLGKQRYKSLKDYRKRLVYVRGKDLAEKYLFCNCTAGCTILVKREIAIEAGQIPDRTYWDHWICVIASIKGKISFVNQALLSYRIHGKNQSGVLARINTKEDYEKERIDGMFIRIKTVSERGYHYKNQRQVEAAAYARKEKNFFQMWKYRKFCKKEVYFEIWMKFMPEFCFSKVITKLQEKREQTEKNIE